VGGWHIRWLRPTLRLLGSFPFRMTRKTWPGGRSRVDPFHFVLCKGQKSLLISPFPIRERTALNVNVERTIRITDRVRTKVAEDSLHNGFVLLRGAIQTVVGREFRTTRVYKRSPLNLVVEPMGGLVTTRRGKQNVKDVGTRGPCPRKRPRAVTPGRAGPSNASGPVSSGPHTPHKTRVESRSGVGRKAKMEKRGCIIAETPS
jgi:hypothetical protein